MRYALRSPFSQTFTPLCVHESQSSILNMGRSYFLQVPELASISMQYSQLPQFLTVLPLVKRGGSMPRLIDLPLLTSHLS